MLTARTRKIERLRTENAMRLNDQRLARAIADCQ
jgi:hypothetical protein